MSEASIEVFSEEIDFQYKTPDNLYSWIASTIKAEGKSLSYLNIIFCDDQYLLKINQDYLQHDYYTDIITFHYEEEAAPIEGELFISIDRVKDNAETLKVSFDAELHRVIIHGVLHLCGYGDKTEEEQAIMRSKEDAYLSLKPNLPKG